MAYIGVDLIDVLNAPRVEPPGELEQLMASIQSHGLLNKITVMANPDQPGRYIILAGRRRLAAMQRLSRRTISCQIKPYSVIHGEMIEISENFHRLDLTDAERQHAIVRYAELLRAMANEEAASITSGTPTASTPLTGYKKREPLVVRKVSEDLGVSERTTQRVLRRAEAFTEDQRQTLETAGVPAHRVDRLASVPDPEKRELVVDAIADGVSFPDAMAGAIGENYQRGESDLSDEEWLATLGLSKVKVDQKRFRADALFYRKTQQLKLEFIADLNWEQLKDMAQKKGAGIYFRRLMLFLDCPHPRQWIKCGGCTAGVAQGREHQACRGGGYLLS